MDWSDGEYEITARALEPAARRAVDAAKVRAGMRVLDLGAGTGNAALEAARRGAEVVAVDPAGRLLDVCRARAAEQGLSVTVERGDAGRIPAGDASFDALLSVFAVIFAPDAELATSEMLRVVRPGGTVVVTSWIPAGPIAKAGSILREAMARVEPATTGRPTPAWGDPAFVRGLFTPRGAAVSIEEDTLAFEADSPEAWFEEQTRNHPMWRRAREQLAHMPGEWERTRERSVEALRAENEDASRFRATSRYLVIVATRPE